MQTRTALALCSLLSGITLLTGCMDGAAGSSAQEKVYKVTGKITMSGAAVPNAIVTFSPSGKQPAATGRCDTQGNFVLTTYDAGDGAAAGEYKVLVTKEGAAPAAGAGPTGHDPKNKVPTDGQAMHAARAAAGGGAQNSGLLPTKYSSATTTDLLAVVKTDGTNEFTFDLKP